MSLKAYRSLPTTRKPELFLLPPFGQPPLTEQFLVMERAIRAKYFLKLTTSAACILGLCIQLSYISSRYFKYYSKTTLVVNLIDDIKFPSLSTCFKFNDIIDIDDISINTGLSLKRWTHLNYSSSEFHHATSRFTVSDWFKYTPTIDHVFNEPIGCRIRYPGKYAAKPYNSSTCSKFFKISKNIYGDVMCYSFGPKSTDHSYLKITSHRQFNGLQLKHSL